MNRVRSYWQRRSSSFSLCQSCSYTSRSANRSGGCRLILYNSVDTDTSASIYAAATTEFSPPSASRLRFSSFFGPCSSVSPRDPRSFATHSRSFFLTSSPCNFIAQAEQPQRPQILDKLSVPEPVRNTSSVASGKPSKFSHGSPGQA